MGKGLKAACWWEEMDSFVGIKRCVENRLHFLLFNSACTQSWSGCFKSNRIFRLQVFALTFNWIKNKAHFRLSVKMINLWADQCRGDITSRQREFDMEAVALMLGLWLKRLMDNKLDNPVTCLHINEECSCVINKFESYHIIFHSCRITYSLWAQYSRQMPMMPLNWEVTSK